MLNGGWVVVTRIHLMMRCVFFFQAEDGIRYLVRSRGLGDVYKRQLIEGPALCGVGLGVLGRLSGVCSSSVRERGSVAAVSYTHLTLPTSELV